MTELALLRAVARHPDEDTPRLAYADWLDENGRHERAEFIRGQVEYAATPDDSPRRREIAFRCRQLLDVHESQWLEPFEALERDLLWRRGFVETLETCVGDLDAEDGQLFDTTPFRRLWVRKLDGKADGLELVPKDNHLVALDLMANDLTTNALKKLARLTHFPHVRELGLVANNLRDTAVKVLTGEDFFQRLSLIRLAGNPFTPAARDNLRAHFGDRVSFAFDRDPDRLYTIRDDYLKAGWGREHTQLLMLSVMRRQWLAVFDHAGSLLRTDERDVPAAEVGNHIGQEARRREVQDAWFAELGWESATIRVKRFARTASAELTPFNWWIQECDQPNHPERGDRVTWVHRWLDRGKYRFWFGGSDAWFDRNGEVTDT